jgi:hypothetical protein
MMFSSLILAILLLGSEHDGRLVFEKNTGQAAADIRYLLEAPNYQLQWKRGEMALVFRGRILRIQFNGRLNGLVPEGHGRLDRLIRNINSADAGDKQTIQKFASVKYESLYPGIDLACYIRRGKLECDFVAMPGAQPEQIRLDLDGADHIALDDDGGLTIQIADQEIHLPKPNAFQLEHGSRKVVDVRFQLTDMHEIGFVTGEYNHLIPLIIDAQ